MALTRPGRVTALALGISAVLATNAGAQSKDAKSDHSGVDRRHVQARNQSDTKPKGDSETVNKTVAFPSNGTLKVDSFSGYVHITATGGRDVVIKAVRTAERDTLTRVHFVVDTSGSTVSIQANKTDDRDRHDNNVVWTELDVEVPASARLDVTAFSAPVEIKGVTGDLKLDTFNGKITVTGAKGDVNAHTFSGDVDVDLSGAGSSPSARAHTFSGSIRVKLADSAKADVEFDTFSGEFNSDLPLTMHSGKRKNVSGRINGDSRNAASSSASLKFDTFSGDVKIVK